MFKLPLHAAAIRKPCILGIQQQLEAPLACGWQEVPALLFVHVPLVSTRKLHGL